MIQSLRVSGKPGNPKASDLSKLGGSGNRSQSAERNVFSPGCSSGPPAAPVPVILGENFGESIATGHIMKK